MQPAAQQVPVQLVFLSLFILVWQLFWKGVALWKAAKGGQKRWFSAFIVLAYFNLLAIPELIFLFRFAKHPLTLKEIQGWFSQNKKNHHKSS